MNFYLDLYIETKNDLPFTQSQSKIAYKGGCISSESLKALKVSTKHSKVELSMLKEKLLSKVSFDVWRNVDEFEIISPL